MKKKIIKTLCIVMATIVLAVPVYLVYVVLSYHRVEDNLTLEIEGNATKNAPVNTELSLLTYNIGFGAYSADYSFFMDGGEHSRAISKDAVLNNTNGVLDVIADKNPDFVLLQEVDIDGTRSYHINQKNLIAEKLEGFDSVFAENYNSPYFLYPIYEPIGANESGILTLSRFNIESSIRRSLPVENSLDKYFDLDRAYSVSVLKTDNGKDLVLYNVHLSAYTSDGTIADDQLKMLSEDMLLQYEKGNYIIAAGDFNKDMLGDSSKYFERPEGQYNWAAPFNNSLLPKGIKSYSGSNSPTCRNAEAPYKGDGTDFVLSVDGVLVSDNVEVLSCETVDTSFAYSDHNPVTLKFVLNHK
ncbi:MAG: endonuclease/exonuclease/phosphatase family protein [Acutalibacteraceae bacterium]